MVERKSVIRLDLSLRLFIKALDFYHEKTGSKSYSEKLKREVEFNIVLPELNPYLGIAIKNTHFRNINVHYYSIVYRILENDIVIELFWDTRRNSKNIS